jgi:tight adherence protein C
MYMLGGMIIASIGLVIYALWPKRQDPGEAIKRRIKGRGARASAADNARKNRESVAKRMIEAVAPVAIRPANITNPEEMTKLRWKLANAGFRSESAPTTFLASKTVAALGIALVAGIYAWMKGEPMLNAAGIVLFGAAVGFMAPNTWLNMAADKRKGRIRQGLPDCLDLMVISVESGLGLDAALQRVSDEMDRVHPALAQEFQIVTREAQMGIPRSEALSNCSMRTGVEEIQSLVAIINQAERFGSSVARALRNQSAALRVKRRQNAEERAQKTAVKLMAPLIMFIFPAIMVVIGGPAILKMYDVLMSGRF